MISFVAASTTTPLPTWLLLGMVLACMVGGLPHGAMDSWIGAWWLRPRLGRWWWLPFSIGYVAIAALVVVLWRAFPVPSLVTFLGLSFLHFSLNQAESTPSFHGTPLRGWKDGFAIWRGTCVIVGPILLHPAATADIFGALTGQSAWSVWLSAARPFLLGMAGVSGLLLLRSAFALRAGVPALAGASASAAVLTLSAVLLHPLLSFTLYFCLWHSPAHRRETEAEARLRLTPNTLRRTEYTLKAVTALAMIFLLAGYLLLPATLSADSRLLMTLFIGLAALTAPHMLLQALWENARRSTPPAIRTS